MSNRKLVMEEHDGKTLVGMQKTDCDPIVETVEGDLFAALLKVNELLAKAEEQWAKTPKNPPYKPPAKPKPKASPAATTTGKKAEELPLLTGKDKTQPAAEAVKEAAPEQPTEAAAEVPVEETTAGTEGKTAETTGAAEEQAPEIAVPATEPEAKSKPVEEKPAEVAAQPAAPTPEPAAAAPTGAVGFWLKDGRGPFADIQKAMDEMGMDKDNRPHHNRWDRLSTTLKEQIQRRPKA